jgi:arsenical pump membrane protein
VDLLADVLSRMGPVLVFLVAVTALAELADTAQVFDVAAREAARWARGRTPALFVLVAALATTTTVLLGLDTTAVLLTPVVLSMAVQLEVAAVPFAMLTVWLANTASLLLPVSNLTNLLAVDQLSLGPHELAGRMWLPTLVAVAVTMLVVGVRYRSSLTGTFRVPPPPLVEDRVLFGAASVACLGIVPALLLGGDPTVVVSVASLALAAVFAVRRRDVLGLRLVPWRLAVIVLGLAVSVEALLRSGLDRVADTVTGQGDGWADLLQVAGLGTVASNVLNNLPAYLLLEPSAAQANPARLLALLVGTNAGPLVLVWGSLATLLWRERCRARGVVVSAREIAVLGVMGVPLVVAAATLAVTAT